MYEKCLYMFTGKIIYKQIFWMLLLASVLIASIKIVGKNYQLREYEMDQTVEDTKKMFSGLFN